MAAMGRPRDARLTDEILTATLRLLGEQGYDALTIEGVARAAGVSRSTVYKRWPILADLVIDATFHARQQAAAYAGDGSLTLPDTGTLRGDLRAFTIAGLQLLTDLDQADVLRGLLAEAMHHPHVSARVNELFLVPDEEQLEVLFQRAHDRGEIADLERARYVPKLLQAYGLIRAVMLREPVDQDAVETLVDLLLDGITSRKDSPPGL